MEHSKIGASSAHRWMACPGSVALSALAPPEPPNKYAEQGTAAHWVMEQYFTADLAGKPIDVWEFEGVAAPNGYVLTNEDLESVQAFVKYVNDVRRGGKYILHVEAKFDLERIHEGLFGTSDVVLIESNMKRLKVIDYKHGAGVPVEVEDNKQLKYYALGAIAYVCKVYGLDWIDILGWGSTFEEVEIAVVQPRCRHKSGAVRSWVVPADTLDKFTNELYAAATKTRDPKAGLAPGDHCRFCPALAICPALNKAVQDMVQTDFAPVSDPVNLKLPRPEALSDAEISKVLRFADIIGEWLKAVESHAQTILEHGGKLPGWKLVQKKTNRTWIDEEAAKATLELFVAEKDLYEQKFLSPAKAEKLLGKVQKKVVEDLCFKPEGANTLAPEHDPREEVKGSASTDFESLSAPEIKVVEDAASRFI